MCLERQFSSIIKQRIWRESSRAQNIVGQFQQLVRYTISCTYVDRLYTSAVYKHNSRRNCRPGRTPFNTQFVPFADGIHVYYTMYNIHCILFKFDLDFFSVLHMQNCRTAIRQATKLWQLMLNRLFGAVLRLT